MTAGQYYGVPERRGQDRHLRAVQHVHVDRHHLRLQDPAERLIGQLHVQRGRRLCQPPGELRELLGRLPVRQLAAQRPADGAQGAGTTETGAYTLDGYNGIDGLTIQRERRTGTWAVTSEDEWYKAAYYNPATSSYYDYPTSSNSINTGMANYEACPLDTQPMLAPTPYPSPYGTFDQGGNVWEWNETAHGSCRDLRARRSTTIPTKPCGASWRWEGIAANEFSNVGFRVAAVPEPATLMLLAIGGLAVTRRRDCRA